MTNTATSTDNGDVLGELAGADAKNGAKQMPNCKVPGCGAGPFKGFELANHMRLEHPKPKAAESAPSAAVDTRRSTTTPPSDAKAKRKPKGGTDEAPEGKKPTMGEATAWIEHNLQPGILRLAAMTGIPKEMLAQTVMESGVEIWDPLRPTPIGAAIQLDDMAIQVYAAAYVYGQDTWLEQMMEKYAKQLLPIGLAAVVAVVTLGHIAKVSAIRKQVTELVQMQAAAQAEAMRQAQAQADSERDAA